MRKLGALATLFVVAGCGAPSGRCTPVADPEGLWARAQVARVDVYGAQAHCAGGVVAAGAGPATSTRDFDATRPIALDVPAGPHAIVLTLFTDGAATLAIGAACAEGNFAAGSSACLTLSLEEFPDGGVCGACPPGSFCAGAACQPGCAADPDCAGSDGGAELTCCDHQCVDLERDPRNCGGCGAACSTAHATPACVAGACAFACDPGFGHCASGNSGCETDLASAGLAPCGASCIPAASCCASSDCNAPPGPAACYAASCSGAGGTCSYAIPAGDVVCGATCCRPVAGACNADCSLNCAVGFADCDADPANGCEQDLHTAGHCGDCWKACNFAHGVAACPTGSCVLAGCDAGYANCDGQPDNGCECAGSGCCAGGCEVAHTNGLGQTFYDCAALGTLNAAEALAACTAFTGDASQCHATTCASGDLAVCSDGSPSACDCWIYAGAYAGHVKTGSPGACGCSAHPNSPTWS